MLPSRKDPNAGSSAISETKPDAMPADGGFQALDQMGKKIEYYALDLDLKELLDYTHPHISISTQTPLLFYSICHRHSSSGPPTELVPALFSGHSPLLTRHPQLFYYQYYMAIL